MTGLIARAAAMLIIGLGLGLIAVTLIGSVGDAEQRFVDDCARADGQPIELEGRDYCRIGNELVPR